MDAYRAGGSERRLGADTGPLGQAGDSLWTCQSGGCGVAEFAQSPYSCLPLETPLGACPSASQYATDLTFVPALNFQEVMGDYTTSSSLPKTRQKNCNGCVQAKRRCDRSMPICSRCAEKKVACIYGKASHEHQSGEEAELMDFSMTAQAIGSSASTPAGFAWSADLNPGEGSTTPFMLNANAAESFQNYLMDPSIDVELPFDGSLDLVGNHASNQDQWLVHVDPEPSQERSTSPIDDEVLQAYDKMAGVCVRLTQIQVSFQFLPPPTLDCIPSQKPGLIVNLRTASNRGISMTQQPHYTS